MKYLLADYLREEVRWRLDKAAEYNDDRTAESADALEDLATFVEHLPDDDLRLRQIDAAYRASELGEFHPGDRAQNLIHTWGFQWRGLGGAPEWFLELLVEHSAEDAVEYSRNFGDHESGLQG